MITAAPQIERRLVKTVSLTIGFWASRTSWSEASLPGQISEFFEGSCTGFSQCAGRVYGRSASSVQCASHVGFPQAGVPQAMAKSTISESMPTTALRDPGVPDMLLAERPFVPKSRVARMDEGRNLRRRLQFDRIALLLQGGGALGAYQAGVYQALAEADFIPTGSPASRSAPSTPRSSPATRPRRASTSCARSGRKSPHRHGIPRRCLRPSLARGEAARSSLNQVSAAMAASVGASRLLHAAHHRSVVSSARHHRGDQLLRHAAAKATLERFVDFDRMNAGETKRVSASARSMCAPATSSISTPNAA